MKNHLSDYVKVYTNALSRDLCRETLEDIKLNGTWEQHGWSGTSYGSTKPKNGDKEPSTIREVASTNKDLLESIRDALVEYFIDVECPWFGSWEGYSCPKFLRYKVGNIMSKHYDHIYGLYGNGAPVLSIIGSLNSDYEGGELVLFDDTRYHLKEGDVIIFPSNFLYPHQVRPVTKGERYTFVSWTN